MNPLGSTVVPPGVVSDTVAVPGAPCGVAAVTTVGLTDVMTADPPPTVTDTVPERFVPLIVITVPPEIGPTFGAIDWIEGAGT